MLTLYSWLLWNYDPSLIRGTWWHDYEWKCKSLWGTPSNAVMQQSNAGREVMWAQAIKHGHCAVHSVTNKGTERGGEVSVGIFNNIWGVSGTESLSGKPQNFFVWSFSVIARGVAENEQISRGHCRLFYSQQLSTCSCLLITTVTSGTDKQVF